MNHLKAFTLIELLIVVAIIAILAAIAVPNFLEAQTRAKVSRAEADMRTLATGIESYYVDNNRYPPLVAPNSPFWLNGSGAINGPSIFNPNSAEGVSTRFIHLTTPISYITSVFRDPFIPANVGVALDVDNDPRPEYDTYDYVDAASVWPGGIIGGNRGGGITSGAQWHIVSAGPDRINAFGGGRTTDDERDFGADYDPTNGTISSGDIVRIGGGPHPYDAVEPSYDRVQNIKNF